MRLFLDANILFLAGYSSSNPVHDLIALGRAGRCVLLASAYAIEEASRNLDLKGPGEAKSRFEAARAHVTVVPEAAPVFLERASATRLSDRTDLPILAAAIQCRAEALVTGDRRAFGPHFGTSLAGIEILRLRDALRRVVGLPLG